MVSICSGSLDEVLRKVWRYQRGNHDQKPLIEGQTLQWSYEKGQKDKIWSTKHYTEN
jgi:hypothetical protein